MYEIKTNGKNVNQTASEKAAYAMMADQLSQPASRTIEMNSLTNDGNTGWLVRTPMHKITR